MTRLKKFEIVFTNRQIVYFPGQCVQGHLLVELQEEMNMRGIFLNCHGKGQVAWKQGKQHMSATEDYLNVTLRLFGNESNEGDVILNAGNHAFPFQILLPINAPGSCEGLENCYVRYSLKASIDRPWKFNKHYKMVFTVGSVLDLNTVLNAGTPVQATDSKTVCCLCCESDPVSATFRLDKVAFVPGETIVFDADIQDGTGRGINSSVVKLIMSGETMIGHLHGEMTRLLQKLLGRFVTTKVIREQSDLTKVPYQEMNNQHDDDRLADDWHARDYMENNEVNPEVTQKFFSHVRSFYCQLVSTLLNKFPFHDKVLQSLGFLNPETKDTVSANEVGALSERFLQHDKKQMSVVMDEYEEFLLYPANDFIQTDLSTTDTNTADQLQPEPLQTFWKKVEDKRWTIYQTPAGAKNEQKREVAKVAHGTVSPGGSDTWRREKLRVPPLPPSFLPNCNIIDIQYIMELVVDVANTPFDLHLPLTVVIGTIPLHSTVQQYRPQLLSSQPVTEQPQGAQGIQPSAPQDSELPPPSYRECVLGKVDTMEEDEQYATGERSFAPSYTYYDWM